MKNFDEDGNLRSISTQEIEAYYNRGYDDVIRKLTFELIEDSIDELYEYGKISKELSQVLKLMMEIK